MNHMIFLGLQHGEGCVRHDHAALYNVMAVSPPQIVNGLIQMLFLDPNGRIIRKGKLHGGLRRNQS